MYIHYSVLYVISELMDNSKAIEDSNDSIPYEYIYTMVFQLTVNKLDYEIIFT